MMEFDFNTTNNTNVLNTNDVADLTIDSAVSNDMTGVRGWPTTHFNGQAQNPIRTVNIEATELPRKWTWKATVRGEAPAIKAKELYMRGGQACNSVIIQCKQEIYAKYPHERIKFELDPQPRAKEGLKVTGQTFLNSVLRQFGGATKRAKVTVTADEHVYFNPNVVGIKVFELEHPRSPEHACWIAQVCDDDKQLAFELRSQGLSDAARNEIVEQIKQLVRDRLQNDGVSFEEESHEKQPDKLREDTDAWLQSATMRPGIFAAWASWFRDSFS